MDHRVHRIDPSAARGPNLKLTVSEQLANRLLTETRSDSAVVQDCVLGARVCGHQTTNSQLWMDFRPGRQFAHIDVRLTGTTRSDTVGTTPQASVSTVGEHSFALAKPVYFNGERILTRRPSVRVDPRNRNVGVRTAFSGVPLIGYLADQQALRVAEQMRPQAESIAGRRLSERLSPEFNRSLDAELEKLNGALRGTLRESLDRLGLRPAMQWVSTTDRSMTYTALLDGLSGSTMATASIAASTESPGRSSLQLHESFVNAVIDRLQLEGAVVTDRMMMRLVGRIVAAIPGAVEVPALVDDNGTDEAQFLTIRFDRVDPVRVEMLDGYAVITIRAAVQPVDGEPIPRLSIRIPVRVRMLDGTLIAEVGHVGMTSVDPRDNTESLATTIAGIQRRLRQLGKSRKLPDTVTLPGRSDRQSTITISHVGSRDGWLRIAFD